jgi:hypothetical protein
VAVGAGSSPASPIPVPSTGAVWEVVFESVLGLLAGGGAALVAAFAVATLRGRRRRRREPGEIAELPGPPPVPWWLKLLAVLAPLAILGSLMGWLVWIALHPTTVHVAGHLPVPGLGASSGTLPIPPASPGSGIPAALWVGALVGVALVLAVAAAVLMLRWRRQRAAFAALPLPAPVQMPAQAVDAALDALGSEADPRRAVIAAYAAMERLLAGAGSPRRPSDAPTEHLERNLILLGASRPAAHRLIELFERARFSLHRIDEPVRQAALEALAAVRGDLELAGAMR